MTPKQAIAQALWVHTPALKQPDPEIVLCQCGEGHFSPSHMADVALMALAGNGYTVTRGG